MVHTVALNDVPMRNLGHNIRHLHDVCGTPVSYADPLHGHLDTIFFPQKIHFAKHFFSNQHLSSWERNIAQSSPWIREPVSLNTGHWYNTSMGQDRIVCKMAVQKDVRVMGTSGKLEKKRKAKHNALTGEDSEKCMIWRSIRCTIVT